MKRIALLSAVILCATMLVSAQEKSKGTEMTGYICNSKCINPSVGKAACDLNCTDKSGEVVFVDDQGKVTPIMNPGKVKDDMGKKVKVHGEMKKKKGKDMMEIYDITGIFG